MKKLHTLAAMAALSVVSMSAHADLLEWGAEARTSIADCPSFCTNFSFGDSLGGQGTGFTGISEIDSFRGSARASAQLTGGFNTPVLKTESFANNNSNGAFATAFGSQGYTYNGAGETLVLDITLDGLVVDPENDPLDTRIYLDVVLFDPGEYAYFSDLASLLFEFGAEPLQQSGGSGDARTRLEIDGNTAVDPLTGKSTVTTQLSIDVGTGQEFYLFAFQRSEAESGLISTSADAFNTGSMSFQGAPELVAASGPVVPVPAAVWLFASGLLGLVGVARRRTA